MRRFYIGLLSVLLLQPLFADTSYEPLLNQVTLQLNAEQWVASKTALVTIGVNASVADAGVEKIQADVLAKLNQISNKGEWHLTAFNRNQDQSGLEHLQITAQTRLPSAELGGLRAKAKAISKPGETYTLDNVEFSASADELRDANINLRNDIYQQTKVELANLAKYYPDQKFYLHNINFLGMVSYPQPQNEMYMKTAAAPAKSNLSVGDKLRLSATVILAAAPNPDVAKIVHS